MQNRLSGIVKEGIAVLFLLICTVALPAQEFKATAQLDTSQMLIGDQTNLSLSFTFPATTRVNWPAVPDTILGYIQVLDRTKIDTMLSQDRKWITLQQKLRVTSFDSGLYTIPPFRFYFRELPDTTLHFSQSETLVLSVHTVSVDTTREIKPIKGVMKVPLTFRELLPWILIAVLAFVIAGLVWYFLKKRKKSEPIFILKPRIVPKPHEIALAELEKVRIKKLWQTGKIKEFHTEVTDILRRYLEDRFGIMALESTTDEILYSIRSHSEPQDHMVYEKLQQVLILADLVKFAKSEPLPAENEQSLQLAVDIVQLTIPVAKEINMEKTKEE